MEQSAIARQAQNNHKLNYSRVATENDMMLGALVSQKSGIDFMQNCDLPPPVKVFTGLDKAVVLSMNSVCSLGRENDKFHDHVCRNEGVEDEKLEILKALRLSQTRAREAERKASGLAEEKERILNAFMKDSLQLFAYRQWVRLLEIQVSKLQSQLLKQEKNSHHCCDKPEGKRLVQEVIEGGNGDEMSWLVALALCLGIASVGFAFGCRFLF
ncbi:uncharacterized protein LOC111293183 [Durio zibethinus]|uniref:Uncharacterized protein LOC111293183 n=1 Tax=Durio zibethinus TaxID=66656 RepID=A0A6P5YME4_DURZI|nr:uncharacterized protein LOC111293183 [Durio zibethinus]